MNILLETTTMNTDYADDALEEFNKAKVKELIPVFVYVGVMMAVGLIGNILVCVFYWTKTKQTCTTRLILAVAVIDTVICVLMPKNFVDLYMTYKFTSSALCKLMYFVNHITAVSSMLVLASIAVFRYRAICKPFERQFTLRNSTYAIIASTIIAFVISFPVLFLYEAVPITISKRNNMTIVAHDCTSSNKDNIKIPLMIVNGIHFCIMVGLSIMFFVLYGLIVRVIWHHVRRQNPASVKYDRDKRTSESKQETISEGISDERDSGQQSSKDNSPCSSFDNCNATPNSNSPRSCPKMALSRNMTTLMAPKHTMMLFSVTIVFVVSFMPYLVVTVRNSLSDDDDDDEMTVGIQLAVRSYLINSAVNPFIYGLCNSQFRQFAYSVCIETWLQKMRCLKRGRT